VVCGAINVDLLATADHKPLPDDSTPGRLRRCAGGVGRNIAENLVRLGIDVTLISAVGDDDFGRRIVERDKQTGVDVSQIQVSPDWPTASYTAIHGPDGELLHAVSDMRLFDQFSLPVSPDFSTRYNSTDLLVIDANLPESVIKTLAQSYHPKFIAAEAVSPLLSLLKVNRAEACALTGCTADDERLLESLLELGPAQVLLIQFTQCRSVLPWYLPMESGMRCSVECWRLICTDTLLRSNFSGALQHQLRRSVYTLPAPRV